MTVGTLCMALIDHNLILQGHTTNFLAGSCIGKRLDHQVILLWHHHEFHTLLPVAEAIEFEILANKIGCGFFRHNAVGVARWLSKDTLIDIACLNNVRVLLSSGHHKQ